MCTAPAPSHDATSAARGSALREALSAPPVVLGNDLLAPRCLHLNGQSGLTAFPPGREFPLTPPGVLAQYAEARPRHRIGKRQNGAKENKMELPL